MSENGQETCRICGLDGGSCQCEELRRQVEERKKVLDEALGGDEPTGAIDSKLIRECLQANEKGDGQLFAELHRKDFIHNANADEWLRWVGHHWERDVTRRGLACCENVAQLYLAEAGKINQKIHEIRSAGGEDGIAKLEQAAKAHYKRANRLRSAFGRNKCLEFARTLPVDPMVIDGSALDNQPWLLACANGVIDLQTGRLRDGRQEDYLLTASPIEWHGIDAPRALWEKSLLQIYNGDEELYRFVQRLFGMAIVGRQTEDVLPVLSGAGANGKTKVLVNMVMSVLGDLAGPIPAEMLLDQGKFRSSAGPSPDIMTLRGLRIAFASETDEHRRFSTSRVKWLTGDEKQLTGRNPNDRYFTKFAPTHTLFLITNHRPHAPDTDFAFWRRVLLVEHTVRFAESRDSELLSEITADIIKPADKLLPVKLQAELPGILAWLVEGCLLYQKNGLMVPRQVVDATVQYRRSEDQLADFVGDCCQLGEELFAGSSDLHDAYCEWHLEENGSQAKPLSQKKMGGLLKMKFEDGRDSSGRVIYRGIALNEMGQVLNDRTKDKKREKR